jgi:hypothetical protein
MHLFEEKPQDMKEAETGSRPKKNRLFEARKFEIIIDNWGKL